VVVPGDTFTLSASARDARGGSVAGAPIRWRSRRPAVATVDSASGRVAARAPGAVVIAVESGNVRDSVVVDVGRPAPGAPARIAIAKPPQLAVGDSVQLVASTSADSAEARPLAGVRWSSSEPGIVAVDPTRGLAQAVSVGSAIVTAQSGSARGTVVVTVRPGEVASVIIAEPRAMRVGDEQELRVTVTDQRDQVLYGREVLWTSSDTTVATVERADGIVTAVAPGTTRLTATVGGVRATVPLTVSGGAPQPAADPYGRDSQPSAGGYGAPPAAAEPAAGEPPPEAIAELNAGAEAGFALFANFEYKAAADTLSAVEERLRELAREYPRSKQVASLRVTVTRYRLTNLRICEQAAQAARDRGEAPPICQ
jgi:hypothetical protein